MTGNGVASSVCIAAHSGGGVRAAYNTAYHAPRAARRTAGWLAKEGLKETSEDVTLKQMKWRQYQTASCARVSFARGALSAALVCAA